MEKTEPTFVPEWLKNSGGSSTSSSLHSDEQGASKTVRNKSLDKDLGPFRRASVNNGSAQSRKDYSSFNRNQRDRGRGRDRDRDRDKDIFEFRNKERLESRRVDYSDPLGNILPTRFGKNGLRRPHTALSGKRAESGPAKVGSDLSIVKKTSFERDFPSLGVDNDIGKVTSAIQSLPVGNSGVIGGDGWTSALAEVPVIVGSNGNGSSVAPLVQPASVSGAAGGRNMAETLAHGPPRTQTPPSLAVGTQRLEELAVKQSRQLIPMTPSMSKTSALNSSDKQKLKVGPSQFQSSHLTNNPNTLKPVNVKPDVSKPSTVGKLLILKPSRERNGTTPTAKDSLSPTGVGTKLPNNPPAVGPAPLKNGPTVANLEKKPSLQAQSRSNFFNLMRKKSMSNSNSSSSEMSENRVEPVAAREDGPGSTVVDQSSETETKTKVDLTCNGGDTGSEPMRSCVNGKARSGPDAILYSEEEEARLLRAMGWEETAEEEEEGLTEEEISSFLQNYMNVKPASKILNGTLQKQLMAIGKLDS